MRQITIIDARMIHPRCAEIKGKTYEAVVYFTRRGEINGGYQFKPNPERYLPTEEIPASVADAALKAYQSFS